MPLINISADFSRALLVLDRIATALERLSPPISDALLEPNSRKRGLDSLTTYGNNNKQWLKEQFQEEIHSRGLAPSQEEEILDQALSEFPEDEDLEPYMGGS